MNIEREFKLHKQNCLFTGCKLSEGTEVTAQKQTSHQKDSTEVETMDKINELKIIYYLHFMVVLFTLHGLI